MKKYFHKILIFGLLFAIFFSFSIPKKTSAQWSVIDPANLGQNILNVINSGSTAASSYSLSLKEYVGDGLVKLLMNQLLQSITSDLVSWINSGFQGSPMFLRDPGAFFLDAADQLTGDFIAKTGYLSGLCGPFGIDIRASLSLSQMQSQRGRYLCTLSTVLGNAANIPANSTVNGQRMDSFLAGDFEQGGWDGFVALYSEPQNNPRSAFLMADADLRTQIAGNRAQVNADLNIGQGFMSYKKCEVLETVDDDDEEGIQVTSMMYPLAEMKRNPKNNTVEFRSCKTETPGSLISSGLQKSVGSSMDGINMADEINEIFNALLGQLVKKVVIGGLFGASQPSSTGRSYTENLADSQRLIGEATKIKQKVMLEIDTHISRTEEYKVWMDRAVSMLTESLALMNRLDACVNDPANGASVIEIKEFEDLKSLANRNLSPIQLAATNAASTLQTLQQVKIAVQGAVSTSRDDMMTIIESNEKISALISNRSIPSLADIEKAKDTVGSAKEKAESLMNRLQPFVRYCSYSD